MAMLSFYMYTSLILRNTWLYFLLDQYFYYLLFYSIFLPLDKKWSLTSTFEKSSSSSSTSDIKHSDVFVNAATVAIKLLVFWIYLDAGLGKYMDPNEGWAYHAELPALDTYARHTIPAQYLYGIIGTKGLRIMTPLVVWVELLCVSLMFSNQGKVTQNNNTT